MSWEQVRARRLARSRLLEPAGSLVEAARATCGIQAQLQVAAELGLGLRAGATQAEVRRALWEERSLVRTWTLRGTLHLHPADELGLWTAASPGLAETGLEPRRRARLLAAFAEALDGRELLREELADEVARRAGEWARGPLSSGWAYLLGDAVRAGILCSGPPRGAKVTFVRADQWLGEVRAWDEREALLEAARRLVKTYGPVTHRSLVYLAVRGAAAQKALLAELRDELVPVEVEGAQAWLHAADAELPEPAPSTRLVPQWDCYLLGFREHDHVFAAGAKELYWDTRWKKTGRYETPVQFANVLVDGAVAGKWERRVRGGVLDVDARVARPLTRAQRAELEAEAARVARILGTPESQVAICN
ncbi:MAG TPA: winged helix DNA-binding domain-containing protein [Gaiellaceae bacterium]|nr:winged helix DNA-binding domain-containing protein [Gaiellaceae bacterium]